MYEDKLKRNFSITPDSPLFLSDQHAIKLAETFSQTEYPLDVDRILADHDFLLKQRIGVSARIKELTGGRFYDNPNSPQLVEFFSELLKTDEDLMLKLFRLGRPNLMSERTLAVRKFLFDHRDLHPALQPMKDYSTLRGRVHALDMLLDLSAGTGTMKDIFTGISRNSGGFSSAIFDNPFKYKYLKVPDGKSHITLTFPSLFFYLLAQLDFVPSSLYKLFIQFTAHENWKEVLASYYHQTPAEQLGEAEVKTFGTRFLQYLSSWSANSNYILTELRAQAEASNDQHKLTFLSELEDFRAKAGLKFSRRQVTPMGREFRTPGLIGYLNATRADIITTFLYRMQKDPTLAVYRYHGELVPYMATRTSVVFEVPEDWVESQSSRDDIKYYFSRVLDRIGFPQSGDIPFAVSSSKTHYNITSTSPLADDTEESDTQEDSE